MFTIARCKQGLVRLQHEPRAFTCHAGLRSVRKTWSENEKEALARLRSQFVDRLPAGKHESRSEARQRAGNEWRWIVESALNEKVGDVVQHVRDMTTRAVQSDEPLAYILGNQPFGPLSIICRKPTLIPRVETEALVEHVADVFMSELQDSVGVDGCVRVLDLCCGTGCIALLLRHKLSGYLATKYHAASSEMNIVAVDASDSAVELAKENVRALAKETDRTTIIVHKADIFDDEAMSSVMQRYGPFNLVICNPPYIRQSDWSDLDDSVRLWEDRRALVDCTPPKGSDGDGLSFYRRLSDLMKKQEFLTAFDSVAPLVAVEVGHDQATSVKQIFLEACPTASISIWQDQFRIDRGVLVKCVL